MTGLHCMSKSHALDDSYCTSWHCYCTAAKYSSMRPRSTYLLLESKDFPAHGGVPRGSRVRMATDKRHTVVGPLRAATADDRKSSGRPERRQCRFTKGYKIRDKVEPNPLGIIIDLDINESVRGIRVRCRQ